MKPRKNLNLACFLALAGLLTAGNATAQTKPSEQVLKYVPDQASCVFVVPSLEKLISGMKAFGKAIGAPADEGPTARDLLEEPGLIGETEGIDTNGTFVVALWPDSKGPLLVCPVENADTWKKESEAQEAEGGLLKLEVNDEPRYAAIKDKTLIVGHDKEAVEAALKSGEKFAARFREQAGDGAQKNQIILCIDVPAWKSVVEEGFKEMAGAVEAGMGQGGPQNPMTPALLKWFVSELRTIVDEHKAFVMGVQIDEKGIRLGARHDFKPDGKIAGYLKKVRKSKSDPLRGLPEGRGFAIMGCEWEMPEGADTLSEIMLKAMLEGPLKEKAGEDKFKSAVKQISEMYRQVTGYNGILMMPPNGKGLAIVGYYLTKDPKTVMKNMQTAYEVSPELMGAFTGGMSMKFTRSQETIGGAQADVYDMKLETDDAHLKSMMETLYGESPKLYAAPAAEGVLYVMGSGDPAKELFEKALTGKAGKLADSKAVTAARGTLPAGPQVCVLVDLMRMMDMGLGFAGAMGAPIPPIKLPDTPPSYISLGIYMENETVRGELNIAAETIKQIIDATKAMMGGGGGAES